MTQGLNALIGATILNTQGVAIEIRVAIYTAENKQEIATGIIPFSLNTAVIAALLEVVDVKSWEEMTGKYIRVIMETDGDNTFHVKQIGNIMFDKWINVKEMNTDEDMETELTENNT